MSDSPFPPSVLQALDQYESAWRDLYIASAARVYETARAAVKTKGDPDGFAEIVAAEYLRSLLTATMNNKGG